jgi:hypothetical protein
MGPRATLRTLFCGLRSRHRAPTSGTLRPTQRTSSPKPKRESSSKATGRRRRGGQRQPRASARPSVIRRDERCPSKSRAGKSKRPDRARASRLSTCLMRSFLRRGAVSLPVAVRTSSARREQRPNRRELRGLASGGARPLLPCHGDLVREDVPYNGSAALSAEATFLATLHTASSAARGPASLPLPLSPPWRPRPRASRGPSSTEARPPWGPVRAAARAPLPRIRRRQPCPRRRRPEASSVRIHF